jgi:cytoskeletal protein RodZ
MRSCRKNVPLASTVLSKACYTRAFLVVAVLLLVFWAASAGSASAAQSQPQTQSQKASQPGSQSVTAAPKDSGDKQQSLADTSSKANAKTNKPKSKHVYTNDDLSGIGGGISVVGNGSSGSDSAVNGHLSTGPQGDGPASSSDKNEAYWRGRARAIRDQIAAVDQQIDKVKQEIAKSGPAAFDPTTGLTQNVIIVHDRNADLQHLQDRKQNLEKQMDELTDEGRKAGADPGWFR